MTDTAEARVLVRDTISRSIRQSIRPARIRPKRVRVAGGLVFNRESGVDVTCRPGDGIVFKLLAYRQVGETAWTEMSR